VEAEIAVAEVVVGAGLSAAVAEEEEAD